MFPHTDEFFPHLEKARLRRARAAKMGYGIDIPKFQFGILLNSPKPEVLLRTNIDIPPNDRALGFRLLSVLVLSYLLHF